MAEHRIERPEDMVDLGERIGRRIGGPMIFLLEGEMGAGKTQFAKGLAKGLGVPGEVTSPTFSILDLHDGGRWPLFHIDAYRLETLEEAHDAGLEEVFLEEAVVLVEWGRLLKPFFRFPVVRVEIFGSGDMVRVVRMEGAIDDIFGD